MNDKQATILNHPGFIQAQREWNEHLSRKMAKYASVPEAVGLDLRKIHFDPDNYATIAISTTTPEPRTCSICKWPVRGGYCRCTT